ncbi:RNA polymerase sigma factor [uncultured Microbacterium sp.]|uniref:RNA polymerase sigma factor n=1 Tax=uncultured Microbacterium sp. TaxID=191216 RepID=UPI002601FFAE|nr:sigma-70 family RNA polymerase sigma factor [uncultured Microbacterium sp.]
MSFETFADFYSRYYRLILTVAEQRLGGVSDAEDITAEVFRIAWTHHTAGNTLTLAWVYQVLRNVIGNEYRRRVRADQLVDQIGSVLWLNNALASGTDDAAHLRRTLLGMAEEDRELLYMAFWEDLTRTEIAGILGISPGAARVRLTRAKRKLRARLDEQEQEAAERKEANDGRT